MILFDFFAELIARWLTLLLKPLSDPTMLWIIIPIYITWIVTEFFQEKHGTSLGNAISNAFIPVFVGWDWTRTVYNRLVENSLPLGWQAYTKIGLALLLLVYGVQIFMEGLRARKRAQIIGRIRVVTYVVLMLTPIFYGAVQFDFLSLTAMIVFFPLFYFTVELIDRFLPDSQVMEQDTQAVEQDIYVPEEQPRQEPPPTYPHPYPPQRYYQQYQVRR